MSKAPRKTMAAAQPRRSVMEFIVGGTAIVISAISLWVAIDQGRVQQKMLAAGSWPILVADSSNIDDAGQPRISMTVRNDGAGPALLRWVELRYNGKPMPNHVALMDACCIAPGDTNPVTVTTSKLGRSVLAAGKSLDFLILERNGTNQAAWDRLNTERWKVTLDACYCSVLGECWRSALDGGEPRPVKACPKTDSYTE